MIESNKPIYRVRISPKSKRMELWEIVKREATKTTEAITVNDATYESEAAANRHLDTLIALGYCRRGKIK